MDSTLIQPHNNKPSASKLATKRKAPHPNQLLPDPNHEPLDGGAPPFKFHRIWTEPDEIRLLQGILDCSSQNLEFPRDLGILYDRFSNTMSQPFTKSQLSEKLRRLRKKFRVISVRLSKGLDRSQLSTHDRALYDLSKRLWHREYAATSPYSGARNVELSHWNNISGGDSDVCLKKSNLVGVKVEFSPNLSVGMYGFDQENGGNDLNLEVDCVGKENGDGDEGRVNFIDLYDDDNISNNNCIEEFKLSEVNVEFEGGDAAVEEGGRNPYGGGIRATEQNIDFGCEDRIGEVAAKAVMNVFDECLKEVRRLLTGGSGEKVCAESFDARWQQQRIAELDVLRSRLRLVFGHSLQKH